MSEIDEYQKVVDAAKRLLAAQKAVETKGEKFRSMDYRDHSSKARAAASDRLTAACEERDKARDWMHKVLVDAMLTTPYERSAYDTRLVEVSHGFGHRVKTKYTPPLPKCYEN